MMTVVAQLDRIAAPNQQGVSLLESRYVALHGDLPDDRTGSEAPADATSM